MWWLLNFNNISVSFKWVWFCYLSILYPHGHWFGALPVPQLIPGICGPSHAHTQTHTHCGLTHFSFKKKSLRIQNHTSSLWALTCVSSILWCDIFLPSLSGFKQMMKCSDWKENKLELNYLNYVIFCCHLESYQCLKFTPVKHSANREMPHFCLAGEHIISCNEIFHWTWIAFSSWDLHFFKCLPLLKLKNKSGKQNIR